MNAQRYLFLLLRYLWLILLILATGLAGAWMWLKNQSPVYASRAVLEVIVDQAQVINITDVNSNRITGLDALNTVVQSLTSNTILLQVAQATGLAEEWAQQSAGGKVTPEMESALAGTVRLKLNVGLRRGTRLIDIVAEDSSPEKAQKLAESLVKVFLANQSQSRTDVTTQANSFLVEEANKLKRKVEESETKLAEYRTKNDAISLDERQNVVEQRLQALSKQVTDANTQSATIQTDLERLKATDVTDVEAMLRISSLAALPEVAPIRTALSAKESEFATLKERYLELHPKYQAALSELTEYRTKLKQAVVQAAETLRQQYQNFADTERKLTQLFKDAKQESLKLGEIAIPYAALQREAKTDQELYQAVLTRLKETNVTSGLEKSSYRYQEEPLYNPLPVRPNKTKSMILAGFASLALGAGLVLLIDTLDSTVRTVDDAEKAFSAPVLAAVPEGKLDGILPGQTVMSEAPDSPQAEAFRNLRASISLLGDEQTRRIFLITSSIPGEGKTFCSQNLAAALAGQNLKTLVIDADLRRPALSAALIPQDERRADNYRGLTDVLSGQCAVAAAIRGTGMANLSLLPSGRRAPNPSELLAQYDLGGLLDGLLKEYDRIVIDTAPVNAVSDALSIAPSVHAVCMVLMYGKTPRRAVTRALSVLQKTGARIAGLVMNRMPANRGASYYYYYYGDSYAEDNVYGNSNKQGKKRRRDKVA